MDNRRRRPGHFKMYRRIQLYHSTPPGQEEEEEVGYIHDVTSHKINQELDNGPGDDDEVYEYYLS